MSSLKRETVERKIKAIEEKLRSPFLKPDERLFTTIKLDQVKMMLSIFDSLTEEQNNPKMEQEVQILVTVSVNAELSPQEILEYFETMQEDENFSLMSLEVKEEAEIYSDEQTDRARIGIGTKVRDLEDNSISMVIEGNPNNGTSTILLVELEGEYANQVITDPINVKDVNNISDGEFNSLVIGLGQDLDDYEILT